MGSAGRAAKVRRSRHGAHYFDRMSGLNVLLAGQATVNG
jgi:hypothetical protein